MKEVAYVESYISMRFKVELIENGTIFKWVFHAPNLENLNEQIIDKFPRAQILGVIGGG